MKGVPVPEGFEKSVVTETAKAIARSMLGGERKAVFLGSLALQHEKASLLHRAAEGIARACGASLAA